MIENEIRVASPSVCIITMTHNRPEYIKRSFDSLYSRAGISFSHYVFDDASDDETFQLLCELQQKYEFTLVRNRSALGIFQNFHTNIREIPYVYDYYVKFDSDIELLSENVFSELTEVFDFHTAVCGVTPKVEGVYNSQRPEDKLGAVQFFNGHAVRIDAPVVYGCCLMFSKAAFESFRKMTDSELARCREKWGIDSALYSHALKLGKFMIVEDLSVYHIDNTYGQRKKDMLYFTSRSRWNTIDKDEVWFMRLSKEIGPRFLDRSILELLKRSSENEYTSFYNACQSVAEHGFTENINDVTLDKSPDVKVIDIFKALKDAGKEPTCEIFKISAPPNFVPSKNLKKDEVRYYTDIPGWARKDSGIVIEKTVMTITQAKELLYSDPSTLVTRETRLTDSYSIAKELLQQKVGRTGADIIN